MTSFHKPTIKEIYDTIINDYTTRTEKQIPVLKKALIKCFAYAIAGVVCFIWSFAEWQYLQVFIETCDFEALKRWGNLVNIDHKTGTKTVLKIKLENITASTTIQAGTIWKSLVNGLTYKSLSTIYIDTSKTTTALINVECNTSGTIGNLLNDEILHITNPLYAIPETATVNQTITTGTENEDIESYRQRVLTRYKRKAQGGAAIDYYQWTTEVSGIIDCLPYVLETGLITLFCIKSGSGLNRTPTGQIEPNTFPRWQNGQMIDIVGYGQFLSIANSINGSDNTNNRRPLNTKVQLLPPNYTQYKIEIEELSPVNDSLIESIKAGLIAELDKKRPNVKAIGCTVNNATINSNQLNSIVQNIMDSVDGKYNSFTLRNEDNELILNDILGIGCLAYLGELKINSSTINL